jgi:CP family cyanate transporter-like MFS transporter
MPGRRAILVGFVLCGVALRPQLSAVGPLLPRIESDLGVSHGVAGLLGTIPVLCMGLFAPAAPYLSQLLGAQAALAGATALIGVGGVLRAVVPGPAGLLLLTVPVGVGIGLAGTLLPVAVKERFSDRGGFATGAYSTGMLIGAGAGAAVAVPLARAGGGWEAPLLVISAVTVAIVPVLLLLGRGQRVSRRAPRRPPRLPLRSRVGWWLVCVFALQGVTYYGLNAWLADSFVERGWSEADAGLLVALLNVAGLPSGLLVLRFADRGSRNLQILGATTVLALATLAIVLLPGAAWAWAVIAGLASALSFSLLLVLPLDAADEPGEVGAYVGMMLGVGYVLTAIAPFALGAVRDATGSFTTTLWLIVGFAAALAVTGGLLQPRALRARGA